MEHWSSISPSVVAMTRGLPTVAACTEPAKFVKIMAKMRIDTKHERTRR
ncbi:hypothetical protein ACFL5Z_05205 [Planctomycetota bacterium]